MNVRRHWTSNRLAIRPLGLSIALVGLLAVPGDVFAQEAPPPWPLAGSEMAGDPFFDVVTQALLSWGGGTLSYNGGGSSAAEAAMQNAGDTGDKQCLGPLSRDLTPSVAAAHPNWRPTLRNTIGLDAAVILVANYPGHMTNIVLPLDGPGRATENVSTDPFLFGFRGSGYTQLLEIVLAGVDGSGSVRACSDIRRISALLDLSAMQGIPSGIIKHFYRRDDNSGATDLLKEKARIRGFCNGAAVGALGSDKVNPNLNNQDFDPIRRRCTAGRMATACTDMTTGRACTAGDGNPRCTQGLVVAISRADDGADPSDVNATMAQRLVDDRDSVAYAGRGAARKSTGAAAVYVNGIRSSPPMVRLNAYLFSSRLFLHFAADARGGGTCSSPPAPLSPQGGPPRVAAEEAFYDWATNPDTLGRCNLDPILEAGGLIPCLDDCTVDPGLEANNFCNGPYSSIPADAPLLAKVAGEPGPCIPYSDAGGPAWDYGPVACTPSVSICCSTGLPCPDDGQCPAAYGRAADFACSGDTRGVECASGVCGDSFELGNTTYTCQQDPT
jgi:hypothetical protein